MTGRRRLNPHLRPRETSLWPTGSELRAAREQAGLSVPELASRLRWSRASLYEYEAAPRVAPERAEVIFAALGVEAPRSPLSLELVASGGCGPCQDGDRVTPADHHRWWDYRLTITGRTFATLYRLHAFLPVPGDASWHEVPNTAGGPIARWIRGDLHHRAALLSEAVINAADPWPGSGFDPAAYHTTPPWKFWR